MGDDRNRTRTTSDVILDSDVIASQVVSGASPMLMAVQHTPTTPNSMGSYSPALTAMSVMSLSPDSNTSISSPPNFGLLNSPLSPGSTKLAGTTTSPKDRFSLLSASAQSPTSSGASNGMTNGRTCTLSPRTRTLSPTLFGGGTSILNSLPILNLNQTDDQKEDKKEDKKEDNKKDADTNNTATPSSPTLSSKISSTSLRTDSAGSSRTGSPHRNRPTFSSPPLAPSSSPTRGLDSLELEASTPPDLISGGMPVEFRSVKMSRTMFQPHSTGNEEAASNPVPSDSKDTNNKQPVRRSLFGTSEILKQTVTQNSATKVKDAAGMASAAGIAAAGDLHQRPTSPSGVGSKRSRTFETQNVADTDTDNNIDIDTASASASTALKTKNLKTSHVNHHKKNEFVAG